MAFCCNSYSWLSFELCRINAEALSTFYESHLENNFRKNHITETTGTELPMRHGITTFFWVIVCLWHIGTSRFFLSGCWTRHYIVHHHMKHQINSMLWICYFPHHVKVHPFILIRLNQSRYDISRRWIRQFSGRQMKKISRAHTHEVNNDLQNNTLFCMLRKQMLPFTCSIMAKQNKNDVPCTKPFSIQLRKT